MARSFTQRRKVLVTFVVCCVLRLSLGKTFDETLNHYEESEITKKSQDEHNDGERETYHSGIHSADKNHLVHDRRSSQSETQVSQSASLRTPKIALSERLKPRVKRTSSAILLAAARRGLIKRRKNKGRRMESTYTPRTKARHVLSAVRLAAARRRVRVGARRKTPSRLRWQQNRKQQENVVLENTVGGGRADNKGKETDEERRQTEEEDEDEAHIIDEGRHDEKFRQHEDQLRRQEEERRQQEEEQRRQEEEHRRQEEERRRQEEEQRQQEEEQGRQEEEQRQQEEERRRQSEVGRRRLDEIRRQEEERRRQFEESRRKAEEERRRRQDESGGQDVSGGPDGRDQERRAGPDGRDQPTSAPIPDRYNIRYRCRDCRVGDQTFRGHSRFEYVEGCTKYHCICRCNGTKECPDTHTVNVCSGRDNRNRENKNPIDRRVEPGRHGGKKVDPDRTTDRSVEPIRPVDSRVDPDRTTDLSVEPIRPVDSRVDPDRTRDRRVEPSRHVDRRVNPGRTEDRSVDSSCGTCDAKGQIIEGDNFFDLQEDCTLFRDCKCFCNGTWSCSAEKAETICVRTDQGTTIYNENKNMNVNTCQQCTFEGRQYQTRSTFQLINACIATTCVCQCNGSVLCDPGSTVNICNAESTTGRPYVDIVISRNMRKTEDENCQKCSVQGNLVDGNSKFNLKWSCYLDACFCDCQGRYSCVRQLSNNLCDLSTVLKRESIREQDCLGCVVEGRRYSGNTRFQYKQGCISRTCKCTCYGTLECDASSAVNVCVTAPVTVGPQSEISVPGNDNPKQNTCSPCNNNGSTAHGNSYFERRRGCYIEQCHCQCDGRLNCRRIPGQGDILCNETIVQVGSKGDQRICRRCLFQGADYTGNTTFVYTNGCAATNCKCTCNGTVVCDYTSTVNVCEAEATTPVLEERIPSTGKPQNSDGCQVCTVDGKEFAGGSDFELRRGCTVYPCQCSCAGRWGCKVDSAKNVCAADREEATTAASSRCRKCLHEGNEYAGESRFQFTNSCVTINCRCDCSGIIDCDYTSVVNNCVTSVPIQVTHETTKQGISDGCQSCTVDGSDYKGNTNFELKRGCIVYPCQCDCNGKWGCMTDKAKDVCKEDTDDEHEAEERECQNCAVEGRQIQGNSNFTHTHECIERTCICSCKGTVQCDDETAVNVCQVTTTSSPTEKPDRQEVCHRCNLNGKEYQGNTTFLYTDSCTAKLCKCTCTGAIECDDTTAVSVCTTPSWSVTRTLKRKNKKKEGCHGCSVESQAYAGGSKFKLKRGCLSYPCHCDCSGRWWCERNNAKNICTANEDDEESRKSRCHICDVEGRRFTGGSEFRLRRGCLSFKCKCLCDGSWECPEDQASNYCPGSTEATSPVTDVLPVK